MKRIRGKGGEVQAVMMKADVPRVHRQYEQKQLLDRRQQQQQRQQPPPWQQIQQRLVEGQQRQQQHQEQEVRRQEWWEGSSLLPRVVTAFPTAGTCRQLSAPTLPR